MFSSIRSFFKSFRLDVKTCRRSAKRLLGIRSPSSLPKQKITSLPQYALEHFVKGGALPYDFTQQKRQDTAERSVWVSLAALLRSSSAACNQKHKLTAFLLKRVAFRRKLLVLVFLADYVNLVVFRGTHLLLIWSEQQPPQPSKIRPVRKNMFFCTRQNQFFRARLVWGSKHLKQAPQISAFQISNKIVLWPQYSDFLKEMNLPTSTLSKPKTCQTRFFLPRHPELPQKQRLQRRLHRLRQHRRARSSLRHQRRGLVAQVRHGALLGAAEQRSLSCQFLFGFGVLVFAWSWSA